MARKRSIKPEFFDDETMSNISIEARYLYSGLWCHMDGQCLIEASAKVIKAKVFPYDEITHAQVDAWLAQLVDARRLIKFHWQGKDLFYCPTLKKHCRIYDDEKKNFNVDEGLLASLTNNSSLQPTPAQKSAEPGGNVTASVGSGSKRESSIKSAKIKKTNDELDIFIAECFLLYPKRSNTRKADGVKSIRRQLELNPDNRPRFKAACEKYASFIAIQSSRPDWQENFVKQFATFCGSAEKPTWDEWVEWTPGPVVAKPAVNRYGKPEPKPVNLPSAAEVARNEAEARARLDAEAPPVDPEALERATKMFPNLPTFKKPSGAA